MKKNIKIYTKVTTIVMLLGTIFTSLLFQSCDESDSGGGMPIIDYVRMPAIVSSDSLVTHAYMGNTIAIMGQNLQDVNEIWFNDQSAFVNFSFVTSSSIIVTIPNEIPEVVTGKMLLITKNNDTLKYNFGVDVPAPKLDAMVCEYVKDGETAVIKGNFFIDDPNIPLQVFFPGNIEGEITKSSIKEIEVTVPAGVGVGPIQVKSIYGSSRSVFYFRDDRNIVLDFDVLTAAGGWRSGRLADSDPAAINGKYVKFSGSMLGGAGASWAEDDFSFNLWPIANGRADAPLYTGDIAGAAVKFECYVVEPWTASALQMIFTPYATNNTNGYIGDANVPRGIWNPWKESGSFKTEGWITVSMPLSEFKYKNDGGACANPLTADMLRGLTFFVYHGGVDGTDCTPKICIDNIRIVPIK